MSRSNYELIKAYSGPEALAYLAENPCALVLLDVQMPLMDGFKTAMLIRKNAKTKNIPIMFLTASLDEKDRVCRGYEAGAIDYLFKPFEPEILRSKVSFFVQLFKAEIENKYQADLLKAQDEKMSPRFWIMP